MLRKVRQQKGEQSSLNNKISLIITRQRVLRHGSVISRENNLIINHEGSSSGYFAKNLLKDQVFENINVFIKIPEDKNSIITDLLKDKKNYGLAFESEIRNNKDIKIIASIKDNSILYRVLIIAGDNMENAREFLKFLKTNEAKKILKESHLNVD